LAFVGSYGRFQVLYLFHRFEADFSLAFAGVCRYFLAFVGSYGRFLVFSPVSLCLGWFFWHLWAIVGSCGLFLVLSPFALGLMGVSLGNHYLILCEKVWLRVVNYVATEGFLQLFCRIASAGNHVTKVVTLNTVFRASAPPNAETSAARNAARSRSGLEGIGRWTIKRSEDRLDRVAG
jgi:hypothetical protein